MRIKILKLNPFYSAIITLCFDIKLTTFNLVMKKLNKLERDDLAKRVVQIYTEKFHRDTKLTLNHFKIENRCEKTIRRIIKRFEENGKIITSSPPGRKRRKGNEKLETKITKLIQNDRNISSRIASTKLNISQSYYTDIKTNKLNIKSYRKLTAPDYSEGQEKRAKRNSRKIYRNIILKNPKKVFLIDDETYVPVDPKFVPGLQFYHGKDAPIENKIKPKAKYYKKFLIWQCLDENGNVSEPFVANGTINGKLYLEECLKKKMLPFIQKYHKIDEIILWMDMAPCHYSKEVTDWLTSMNIKFITKKQNAPNVPIARPIEKFWSLCKQEYRKRKKLTKSARGMTRIWSNISKKVAAKSAQRLMKELRRNLRLIGYGGVRAPLKQIN